MRPCLYEIIFSFRLYFYLWFSICYASIDTEWVRDQQVYWRINNNFLKAIILHSDDVTNIHLNRFCFNRSLIESVIIFSVGNVYFLKTILFYKNNPSRQICLFIICNKKKRFHRCHFIFFWRMNKFLMKEKNFYNRMNSGEKNSTVFFFSFLFIICHWKG
jgi:hypothetical protein